MFWSPAVVISGPIEYIESTALYGVAGLGRGRCKECKLGLGGHGFRAYTGLSFVVRDRLIPKRSSTLNLFYGSGLQEDTLGLMTVHTDIGSFFYSGMLLARSLPQLCQILLNKLWVGIGSYLFRGGALKK